MTPQEIKLPDFPKYCKDDYKSIKFISPFHAILVTKEGIGLDINEDYDHFVSDWTKWLNDESTGISEFEFEEVFKQTLTKLSNL